MATKEQVRILRLASHLVEHLPLENVLRSAASSTQKEEPFVAPIDKTDVYIEKPQPGEDIPSYIYRIYGKFDITFCRRIIGAANEYKEGDEALGVAAGSDVSRANARTLLSNTTLDWLSKLKLNDDTVTRFIDNFVDWKLFQKRLRGMTMANFKDFLLRADEPRIKEVMPALSSNVIGCVVKLMTNDELQSVSLKVFNVIPGTQIGARGYFGARVQPNSPTDHPEDIVWQVFSAFSYATGDVVLGTNPVDGRPSSIEKVQRALRNVVDAFGLRGELPWCVLGHIDGQYAVEQVESGLVNVLFQSLAGTESCLRTFDLTVEKLERYVRECPSGFYFETGQGADFTNGGAHGVDMVVLEAYKYGLARGLQQLSSVRRGGKPWVFVNDVAGFIGPEVFRTREQLLRCCLEDIVMAKLHGLTAGHDVCATLHMSVSPDDLDWVLDRIAAANPAFCMALPTKNDPMLSYLTTGYQDHVRLRERFDYRVNDALWRFYIRLGIVDGTTGELTRFAGDPVYVYTQFMRGRGDRRPPHVIYGEGLYAADRVVKRGVPLAQGYGSAAWDLRPDLERALRDSVADAKRCLFAQLEPAFLASIPDALVVKTNSLDRMDYILHPVTGEHLSPSAIGALDTLAQSWHGQEPPQVVIIVSDGLNAHAISDPEHLLPFLAALRHDLIAAGVRVLHTHVVLLNGRVRGGYAVGAALFGGAAADARCVTVHVIGERPGTPHHNYSVYVASAPGHVWQQGATDHNMTRVVSGISDTALMPESAALVARDLVLEGLRTPPPRSP